MPRRNLDGRYRNNNLPKSLPNSILISRWVEIETVTLKLMGLSSTDIARRIAGTGRGTQPAMNLLPAGAIFPAGYSITAAACDKALKRALDREPRMGTRTFVQVTMKRTEDLLLSLQLGIRQGNTKAIATAIRIIALQVSIVGPDAIQLSLRATPKTHEKISSGVVGLFQGAIQVLADSGFEIPCNRTPIEPEPKAIETAAEDDKEIEKGSESLAEKKGKDDRSK